MKIMRKAVFFMVVAMVFAVGVHALGIAPASSVIEFEPSKEITTKFRIYNSEQQDFIATIAVNGSLSEYVTIDEKQIQFRKNDRYKTFDARISLPDKNRELTGNIIVYGPQKHVAAELIVMDKDVVLPTGKAVDIPDEQDEESESFMLIIQILLGTIIAGNIIFLAKKFMRTTGIKNARDLLVQLESMDDSTFVQHVTSEKNDFAEWLRKINIPALAYKIYEVNDRMQMMDIIRAHINKEDLPVEGNELKKEIIDLKHELDTFDFREYEHKDL